MSTITALETDKPKTDEVLMDLWLVAGIGNNSPIEYSKILIKR